MATADLMAEYDKADDDTIVKYPSLRDMSREEIMAASEKYEAMMAGKKCKPKKGGKKY